MKIYVLIGSDYDFSRALCASADSNIVEAELTKFKEFEKHKAAFLSHFEYNFKLAYENRKEYLSAQMIDEDQWVKYADGGAMFYEIHETELL